jgi:hypothetical protein
MDDFEYAVESQTLPSFLKQDQDHGLADSTSAPEGGVAGSSQTTAQVGQMELERLMREMSDADLDALAGELGVGDTASKVGLMVPEGAEPVSAGGGANTEIEGALEEVGIKGTTEIVENPDLELEKKFAEVEIGGKITGTGVGEEGEDTSEGLVGKLEKLEEVVVGASTDKADGKEKLD